jgi:regulator of protease activity HflC (stomatin/prohibitin superfamily)
MRYLLIILSLTFIGCGGIWEYGFQTLQAAEYGVVFSKMPQLLGGGLKEKIIGPGEKEFILPWQTLYRVDTSIQLLDWGGGIDGAAQDSSYVETRTIDGNEVSLRIIVQYHVDPAKVGYVIKRVGTSREQIGLLVAAIARSDIRTHMNSLSTSDYIRGTRQEALDSVKESMSNRLNPEGIIIDAVIYKDHQFERQLDETQVAASEGNIETKSYQREIDRIQEVRQLIEQEPKRRAALLREKGKLLAEAKGIVNEQRASAAGYEQTTKLDGEAEFERLKNQALQIVDSGRNEVISMEKLVSALSGPGGAALLKLELAKKLSEHQRKFYLLNPGGGNSLNLSTTNLNEFMNLLKPVAPKVEVPKSEMSKSAEMPK